MRRTGLAAAACAVALAGPAAALELPSPAGQRASDAALLREVGARPDRVLVSVVPGPVVNEERVSVLVDGTGEPARVELEQRLLLTGTGDYSVRERGPARSSLALGDEPPPVTKLGAVVWQGFSPGRRELAARLVLDPALEAPRLPLALTVTYDGQPLGPGGTVPGAGTVLVRLTNATSQPATLPTAADAPAAELATALDRARAAANGPLGARLPTAGRGLPASVPTSGDGRAAGTTGVALRIAGGLRLTAPSGGSPGTVTGPATTPVPGGADVSGTLPPGATAELRVDVTGPAVLELDLSAAPALDPRTLAPPGGAASWRAWAASRPDAAARRTALDLLVATAATGARATSYSPYLGADLPGSGTTTFRYAFAQPSAVRRPAPPLEPRPGPLAATAAGLLLLLAGGAAVWRRS